MRWCVLVHSVPTRFGKLVWPGYSFSQVCKKRQNISPRTYVPGICIDRHIHTDGMERGQQNSCFLAGGIWFGDGIHARWFLRYELILLLMLLSLLSVSQRGSRIQLLFVGAGLLPDMKSNY